jgi:hypothetical protein
MSRPTSAPILALAGALVVSLGLAGCAQTGNTAGNTAGKPAPAKQARQAQNPNNPTRTIDPRDQSAIPAPSRTLPIPGQSPNPTAPAPQGALPDPYANPPR